MTKNNYLTAPLPTKKMPAGIPHILTQETFERFSYYGMRSILIFFMTEDLLGAGGVIDDVKAKEYYHLFYAMTYLMPIFGAGIADMFLGKFKTIMIFSVINILGLLALVLDQTRTGLTAGLVMIAIGSGFIKPCVSSNVGDQFGKNNKHLIERVYGWFYFAINFGSTFSYLLIPWLRNEYSSRVAFTVPVVSMLMATAVFWMGRKRFVHAPPAGLKHVTDSLKGDGIKILGRLGVLFVFIAMFWALFSQMDSSLFLQARHMDLELFGFELLPGYIGAANPIIVMILIPIFSFGLYPAMNKVFRVTPLRKISLGMFVAAAAFVVPAMIEARISEVRYDNQPIGQVTLNGQIKNDLKIEFDSEAADSDAVKGLLASIQFDNSNMDPNKPDTVVRIARVILADSKGASVSNDITIAINDPNDPKSAEIIDGKDVIFAFLGPAVNVTIDDLKIEDDTKYNGGYLLIDRLEGFTAKDTFSISINSDGDSNVLTGIDRDRPSILWTGLAILILTIAEVMVSITILEFSYTQAPKEMKAVIMSVQSLSVFLGSMFASQVNRFIYVEDGPSKLEGASYFWFFAGAMLLTAVVFIPFAARYKEHTFIQEETSEGSD